MDFISNNVKENTFSLLTHFFYLVYLRERMDQGTHSKSFKNSNFDFSFSKLEKLLEGFISNNVKEMTFPFLPVSFI